MWCVASRESWVRWTVAASFGRTSVLRWPTMRCFSMLIVRTSSRRSSWKLRELTISASIHHMATASENTWVVVNWCSMESLLEREGRLRNRCATSSWCSAWANRKCDWCRSEWLKVRGTSTEVSWAGDRLGIGTSNGRNKTELKDRKFLQAPRLVLPNYLLLGIRRSCWNTASKRTLRWNLRVEGMLRFPYLCTCQRSECLTPWGCKSRIEGIKMTSVTGTSSRHQFLPRFHVGVVKGATWLRPVC